MKKLLTFFITFIPLFAIPFSYLQFPYFTSKNTKAKEYFIQGVQSFNAMSYEISKDYFLKSLNIMPEFYFSRKFLAESYFLSGEVESALEEYDILKNQNPYDEFINYRKQNLEKFLMDSKAFETLFLNLNKENSYVLYKEISNVDIKEKNFTPIDIQRDERYIYILNYEPKKILIFHKQGNVIDTISGGILRRLQKPSRFLIHKNKLYITDFEADEVQVYNLLHQKFEKSIQSILYPENILYLSENLYIWSKKDNKFYKYSLNDQSLSALNIDLDLKNQSEFDFTSDGQNIYLALQNKIYKIDISGYILKTVATEVKRIIKIKIYQDTIYFLDDKNNLWKLPLKVFSDGVINVSKIQFSENELFQKIINFYIDEDRIILLDLFGKVYFYNNPFTYNRNLDIFITHIESNKYPLVSIHLKIFDPFFGKTFEDLDHQNFEIFENEKKVFLINAKNREQFQNRLNVLFVYDPNFLSDDFKFESIFKNNLFLFFESFTISDKFLFGLSGDNLKILYKDPYPIDVFDLMKNPPIQEKADLLKNIIQGIHQLISLKGKKCLVIFTNDTSSFRSEADWKKILFLSKIYTIPIFVISLKEKNIDLVDLTRETGGEYYYFYENYYYKKIYERLKSKDFNDYIITYEALTDYHTKLKDRYINVKVKFNYLQMGGYAESGYIIP